VQDFQVAQEGNSVVFSWTDLINDVGLIGYTIAFGPPGSAWSSKEILTEAHRGTEMTNADVAPGMWEFSIRGQDIAGNLGAESLIEFTVSNPNALVIDAIQEPDFVGTISGFVAHPSGVLVPDSLFPMSHYTDYTNFNTFVPDPVSSAYYISPTIDVGYDQNLRVYNTQSATLGPGETGGGAALQYAIDTWLHGDVDPGTFTNWTSAYVEFEYLKGKITYSSITAGNVSYLTDFTVIADVAPNTSQSGTLAVSPGGSTLTFPNPFHTAPYVTATAISSSGLYASVNTITALDCVIHVWDHTGTDVGGNVNWNSVGT
jgi:hypothetical protein